MLPKCRSQHSTFFCVQNVLSGSPGSNFASSEAIGKQLCPRPEPASWARARRTIAAAPQPRMAGLGAETGRRTPNAVGSRVSRGSNIAIACYLHAEASRWRARFLASRLPPRPGLVVLATARDGESHAAHRSSASDQRVHYDRRSAPRPDEGRTLEIVESGANLELQLKILPPKFVGSGLKPAARAGAPVAGPDAAQRRCRHRGLGCPTHARRPPRATSRAAPAVGGCRQSYYEIRHYHYGV